MRKRSKSAEIYECWMKHPTKPVQYGKFMLMHRNMLDEMLLWNKLHPASSNIIFFLFFETLLFCDWANHSNISCNMAKTWCWMKCWTGLLRPYKSWWNEIASWPLLNFAENSLLHFSLKTSAHIFISVLNLFILPKTYENM